MFIVGILSWWYTAGFVGQLKNVGQRLASVVDYFSIDLLARTLFSPFRQISAGRVEGSVAVRWRAFVDKLISRMIGGIIRSFMIVFGIVAMFVAGAIGLISLLLWLLTPFLPLVFVGLFISGWVPSWS